LEDWPVFPWFSAVFAGILLLAGAAFAQTAGPSVPGSPAAAELQAAWTAHESALKAESESDQRLRNAIAGFAQDEGSQVAALMAKEVARPADRAASVVPHPQANRPGVPVAQNLAVGHPPQVPISHPMSAVPPHVTPAPSGPMSFPVKR
jgi:hypothetical protein